MLGNDEKKVEYIELIYDLIFVYLIGKNAALLLGQPRAAWWFCMTGSGG